ncbi:MAG: phosphotyrosine protein phosphatase [Planctomycetota bacterium]
MPPHEPTTHVLFVCGKNKWRSPTAERIFADYPGIECLSAGLGNDSDTVVSVDLVQWADLIFVMEPVHRIKLSARFRGELGDTRVICLDIADRYQAMDPELISLLERRVTPHLH